MPSGGGRPSTPTPEWLAWQAWVADLLKDRDVEKLEAHYRQVQERVDCSQVERRILHEEAKRRRAARRRLLAEGAGRVA